MSKITFQAIDRRMSHHEYGMAHEQEHLVCDLARPAAELRSLATLLDSILWIKDCTVVDATLYVRKAYDVPYVLQERSLHHALAVVRRAFVEGMATLKDEALKPSPAPVANDKIHYSRTACTYTKESGSYAMPEGCYEPGFMIVDETTGSTGYFLSGDRYDSRDKKLAASLLATLVPEASIGEPENESRSYGQVTIGTVVEGLTDSGAACMRVARAMLAQVKYSMASLQFGGHPTAFLDEDDDARDVLMGLMVKGARIGRTRREDAGYDDVDGLFDYFLEDDTQIPAQTVERLINGGKIIPEDGIFGDSPILVAAANLGKADVSPRSQAVSFDMFQNACRYRRHPDDGENECVNDRRGGCNSYCEASSCPILDRVHEDEADNRYGYRGAIMSEEPAFETHLVDERHDPMMIAVDARTRRSFAWRYAGESRMMGVVNQVLGAHLQYGIPLLMESIHESAIDEAVAQGLLVVDDRNAIGVVVSPTQGLLTTYAEQKASRGDAEQERREHQDA